MTAARELAEKLLSIMNINPYEPWHARYTTAFVEELETALREARHRGFAEEAAGCHAHCRNAVLVERERCARIAEMCDIDRHCMTTGAIVKVIAQIIRQPTERK